MVASLSVCFHMKVKSIMLRLSIFIGLPTSKLLSSGSRIQNLQYMQKRNIEIHIIYVHIHILHTFLRYPHYTYKITQNYIQTFIYTYIHTYLENINLCRANQRMHTRVYAWSARTRAWYDTSVGYNKYYRSIHTYIHNTYTHTFTPIKK